MIRLIFIFLYADVARIGLLRVGPDAECLLRQLFCSLGGAASQATSD